MTTAYVTDTRFNAHTLAGHVESAERLKAIHDKLDNTLLNGLPISSHMLRLTPEPATDAQLRACHTEDYLTNVLAWTETQRGVMIGADTYCLPVSFEIAKLSAGAAIRGVDAVLRGEAANALVCARPPGHHAVPDMAMGFCLLGNVSIAARHAQAAYGLKRILIVDFDVHHGNGTQDIFYSDPDVLFISTHRYGRHAFGMYYYPGTGGISEIGEGAGRGATLNIPLPENVGDQGYRLVFEQVIWPAARRFKPELIIVSAGFDAHWADPLRGERLSLSGYARLSRELIRMAVELCGGRIVFVLEGGYHLEVLSHGVLNVAYALLGSPEISDPLGPAAGAETDITNLIERLKTTHDL